ncbi:unnamed protein product [Paramecium pentaurelia]|uniref:Tubulin-tyrosine ligase family protein n=1 Tax=Paramecium pentaurelia TaxID=43138 RepID=A0A8S1S511_9CILI|nr:unnamed protein product [Paramecium pentaurelia]
MFLSVSGSGFHMNYRQEVRLPKLQGHKVQAYSMPKHRQLNSPEEKPISPDRFLKYLNNKVQSQAGVYRNPAAVQSSMILIAKQMKFSSDQHTHRQKEKSIKIIEQSNEYKYNLGLGNNHELVQRIMDTRVDWQQTKDNSSMFVNFRWQQWHRGYKYDRLILNNQYKQMVNHFENHPELSNKQYLFRNLCSYCEQNKQNVYDSVPITFVLDFKDDSVDQQFTQFVKFFDKYAPKKIDQMAKKLVEYKKKLKIPVQPMNDKKIQPIPNKIPKTQNGNQYLWLLKPTFLNRGQGIHVVNDLDTIISLICEYQEGHQTIEDDDVKNNKKNNNIKANSFVIQKYIEQPFLINQRKFDIRVWVLVTQDLHCYFFKEGYIRTSCENYTTDDVSNQFIHLTNNAIQKYSDKYGEFEDGNQLSFDDFQNYLNQQGFNIDFQQNNVTKMKQLVWMSMQSVKRKLNLHQRKYCMEIFGYDFIIDQDFKTWLIEINTNPCIEESSGILKMLLPRMLDDAFKLTIDVIFPPKQKLEINESVFPVNKYSNTESLWESIGNLESPKPAAKQTSIVLPNQLSSQIQQFQTIIPIYQGDL